MEIRIQKSMSEMEEEAKIKHMIKLLHQKDGQIYAVFQEPGQVVRFQDGKTYRIHDDGSLRRVELKAKNKSWIPGHARNDIYEKDTTHR